jgi:hypothetical protein
MSEQTAGDWLFYIVLLVITWVIMIYVLNMTWERTLIPGIAFSGGLYYSLRKKD